MARGALVRVAADEVAVRTSVHESPVIALSAVERVALRVDVLEEAATEIDIDEAI